MAAWLALQREIRLGRLVCAVGFGIHGERLSTTPRNAVRSCVLCNCGIRLGVAPAFACAVGSWTGARGWIPYPAHLRDSSDKGAFILRAVRQEGALRDRGSGNQLLLMRIIRCLADPVIPIILFALSRHAARVRPDPCAVLAPAGAQ